MGWINPIEWTPELTYLEEREAGELFTKEELNSDGRLGRMLVAQALRGKRKQNKTNYRDRPLTCSEIGKILNCSRNQIAHDLRYIKMRVERELRWRRAQETFRTWAPPSR